MVNILIRLLLPIIIISLTGCEIKPTSLTSTSQQKPEIVTTPHDNDNHDEEEPTEEEPFSDNNERPFAFPTLKSWTDTALTWSESSRKFTLIENTEKIILSEIDLAIKTFVQETAQKLEGSQRWLNQSIPEQAFFDTSYFGLSPQKTIDPDKVFFAERIMIPADGKIVVMGDFHGSLHSLIRNLWRLKQENILDNNFKLTNKKTYMIFTGDFVDRGRFSIETLYTLLRLKLANFNQVHLIRGNHESTDTSLRFGLFDELRTKYNDVDGKRLFIDTTNMFRFLPIVIFAAVGDTATKEILHFSHGGYSFNNNTKEFLHSPKNLITASSAISFERIPAELHWGYTWTDFAQRQKATKSTRGLAPTEGAHTSGIDTLNAYLSANNIKAVFRGHQDQEYGLKMLFEDMNDPRIDEAKQNTRAYPNGPYHWKYVVNTSEAIHAASGIPISPYVPVFTFTTAAEGREVPFDAYGILRLAPSYSDMMLEIHEISLSRRPPRSYLSIEKQKDSDDQWIHPSWDINGPGKCLLN